MTHRRKNGGAGHEVGFAPRGFQSLQQGSGGGFIKQHERRIFDQPGGGIKILADGNLLIVHADKVRADNAVGRFLFGEFADQVPGQIFESLQAIGRQRGGDVLLGLFTREPPLPGDRDPRYYNSVVTLGASPAANAWPEICK